MKKRIRHKQPPATPQLPVGPPFLPSNAYHEIGPDKLMIVNPADARCVTWDMAKDVHSRYDAVNLVHILILEEKNANGNPFFIHAVRSLATETRKALHSLAKGR